MIPYTPTLEQPTEERPKIYTLNSIRVATFLCGPLVAGYLTAQNYKAFNEREKVTTTWVITVVAFIAIFGLALFTFNIDRFPKYLFPLAYGWGAFLLVKHLQGEQMKEHFIAGGETFTIWRALLAGLICLIVTLVIIFLVAVGVAVLGPSDL